VLTSRFSEMSVAKSNYWLRNGWDCLDNSTERDETVDSRTEPVNCISS
jgi:hypothetical protein